MSGHRFAGRTSSALGMTSSEVPHRPTHEAPAASTISTGV